MFNYQALDVPDDSSSSLRVDILILFVPVCLPSQQILKTLLFNSSVCTQPSYYPDRHYFQDVHKPISTQLLPEAFPKRFSNDTAKNECEKQSKEVGGGMGSVKAEEEIIAGKTCIRFIYFIIYHFI